MATDLNLFHCEAFHCDLQASACLVNQSRGALEGSLSVYYKCLTCDVGALLREANGGELPEVKFNSNGGIQVVGGDLSPHARHLRKEKPMGKHAVKINNEPVTLPGGQPLTASTPAAAEKLAQALAPAEQSRVPCNTLSRDVTRCEAKVPVRPCKNHPERESLPGKNRLCRECLQAYQREWYARKKQKQGKPVQARPKKETPLKVVIHTPPASAPAFQGRACSVHPDRPAHGKGNVCLECYQASGERTTLAHATLKQFEAGEISTREQFYEQLFDLVPGLGEFMQREAERNLRPLEAEICYRLRESMEAAQK